MPYRLDDEGRPIFSSATMAMHTQNLQADSHTSLLVTQPDASGDPLGASRVTVMGNVRAIPESEVGAGASALPGATPTASTGWTLKIFPSTAWTWWTFTTWAASGSWAGSLPRLIAKRNPTHWLILPVSPPQSPAASFKRPYRKCPAAKLGGIGTRLFLAGHLR